MMPEPDAGTLDAAEPDAAELDAAEPDATTPDAGFEGEAEIQAILDETCTPCHLGGRDAGGLRLDDFLSATLHVPATRTPSLDLIEPGDRAQSYLMLKLLGTMNDGTDRMPPPIAIARRPTPEEIEQIGAFIDGLDLE